MANLTTFLSKSSADIAKERHKQAPTQTYSPQNAEFLYLKNQPDYDNKHFGDSTKIFLPSKTPQLRLQKILKFLCIHPIIKIRTSRIFRYSSLSLESGFFALLEKHTSGIWGHFFTIKI
ncbi:hypothetical protein CEXT_420261 [Caerostris extrusa]|uniref:Uncharacterized protein n=1 Tax=Caerostris extrusa TaxID=172846 RepID=A0AAV4TH77_CAEEX|nr:hypothetical protein CEXT_90281 [Caerostris extrusa]GIY44446.1 hypothetical protein CEXT_420261 [Caerostris extrusa]